jgi:hypothetical protein
MDSARKQNSLRNQHSDHWRESAGANTDHTELESMIRDLPSKADFDEQGLTLLNLAWDSVMDLILDFREMEEWPHPLEAEETEQYKRASQKPLSIATALLQQGTELLVKGAIANVSPYLLIAGGTQAWPKMSGSQEVSFAAFHTPDAVELIRIHDTCASVPFSDRFKQQFHKMRLIRNTVFHSVDRTLRFTEAEILEAILLISHELLGQHQWFQRRSHYLNSTPSAAFSTDWLDHRLVREFRILQDILGAQSLNQYFGFNKRKGRNYICQTCQNSCRVLCDDFVPRTAKLTSSSTEVHCVVCRTSVPVIRRKCKERACKGDVVAVPPDWDSECLTCGTSIDIE